jgi:hypothetical protein
MEKVVRGLNYHHHLRRFGEIELEGQLIQSETQMSRPDLSWVPFVPGRNVGDVITYTYAFASDDPDYSLWAFRFYERALLFVGTGQRAP